MDNFVIACRLNKNRFERDNWFAKACKIFITRWFNLFFIFQIAALTACNKDLTSKPGNPDPPASPTGLNVILILGDDVGYEMLTCDGGQSYSTPNLDNMANQGMRFTQCHSSPLCSPSRFMFLTGKYNYRNYTKWGVMSPSEKTIANMFEDAGYSTCVAGKWQLDGGETSIKNFGFQNYCLFNVFEDGPGNRYKNPDVFENGHYLPDSLTINKYGEDIFNNYILNFLDSATKKKNPFFIYYPMALCHSPFSPTPHDSAFASWNPKNSNSDPSFFPSMAAYMDKKIGVLIDKVKALGIEKNTVIIYTGDNGTPNEITSIFNGESIQGGKGETIEYGTHVPLIAYCPGLIPAASINADLISFPDFLPTVADIAGLNVPKYFNVTDGLSFYSALKGEAGNARDWIFCHYDPYHNSHDKLFRWVQNKNYKLYDFNGNFFNIQKDIMESDPIPLNLMSPLELIYNARFNTILDSLK